MAGKNIYVQGKNVYCPMCHTPMKYARTSSNEQALDIHGDPVLVTRKYYKCPNEDCGTEVNFSFRQDGKEGDLHKIMDMEKKAGKLLRGKRIEGKFDDIDPSPN